MHIVLACHSMTTLTGSERWTAELAEYYFAQRHTVTIFALTWNDAGHRLCAAATQHVDRIDDIPKPVDVIIASQCTTQSILQVIPARWRVHMSHGPEHGLELPIWACDRVIAITPETSLARTCEFGRPDIVYNGVDLSTYQATHPLNKFGKPSVLSLCKDLYAKDTVAEACAQLGWSFDWAHYDKRPRLCIVDLINKADIVVSLGRGAIEALACGRMVVAADGRNGNLTTDGVINPLNCLPIMTNYSGRMYSRPWTADIMANMLRDNYSTDLENWSRRWAEIHHDLWDCAAEYLKGCPNA